MSIWKFHKKCKQRRFDKTMIISLIFPLIDLLLSRRNMKRLTRQTNIFGKSTKNVNKDILMKRFFSLTIPSSLKKENELFRK